MKRIRNWDRADWVRFVRVWLIVSTIVLTGHGVYAYVWHQQQEQTQRWGQ